MKTPLLALAAAATLAGPAAAQQSIAIASGHGHVSMSLTVPFGNSVRLNHWMFTPVRIVEDSRCPRMVTCVWRGRLRVEFAVRGGPNVTLEDGKPVPFGGGTLTLLGGRTLSQRGEKIAPAAYRFQLRFER